MKFRKVLFWTHLAAGLVAGGVIFSMAASGIVMSYQPQLAEWAEQDRRVVAVPASSASRLSLDSLSAFAAAASPKGRTSGVTVKSDPSASVSFAFGREGGNLYLDPYSGAVLGGDSRTYKVLHWVEDWHRYFGFRDAGKPVTGAACLLFFFLLLSGLYMWFPRRWTRAVFRSSAVPSLKLKGRARDWNWHNAVGFWAAPLVLVTTLTGTIISYRWASDLVFVLTGNEPPPKPQEGPRTGGKPAGAAAMEARKEGGNGSREGSEGKARSEAVPRASLDSIFARAQAQVPAWAVINIRLPQKPGGPVTAAIQEIGAPKHARSQLSVDATSGEVKKWEPYAGQNLGRRLRAWVVPLHTGRAGGPAGQFLALLSAAAALLMVWTGVAMAWRRFFKSKAAKAEKTVEPEASTVGSAP